MQSGCCVKIVSSVCHYFFDYFLYSDDGDTQPSDQTDAAGKLEMPNIITITNKSILLRQYRTSFKRVKLRFVFLIFFGSGGLGQ